MEDKYSLIVVVVDNGYTELVMDAARAAGARGGTVLSGRGTTNSEIEEKFRIVISTEKEIVFILTKEIIQDNILQAINSAAGLSTKGRGIAFSLPVEGVAGLKFD